MRRVLLSVTLFLGLALWSSGQVVINEVGWAGTQASGYDEWIELYNPSEAEVDLAGWRLLLGERELALSGTIPPGGFYLLERTDDATIPAVEADLIYKGSMANAGAVLMLFDPEGNAVDSANLGAPEGWFAATWPRRPPWNASPPGSPIARWPGGQGLWVTSTMRTGTPSTGLPGARTPPTPASWGWTSPCRPLP